MFYWLIPYLVAFNVSESDNWKYGPKYVFEAVVFNNVTLPMQEAYSYSNLNMYINCRPINSSLIQCRIEAATEVNYEMTGSTFTKQAEREEKDEMLKVVFQVQFDDVGISKVWYLNTNNSETVNTLQEILGTMNTGINLTDKTFENYVALEKSVDGYCNTSFHIRKNNWSESEEEEASGYRIKDYTLDVPLIDAGRSENEAIVIEKLRNLNECWKDEKDAIQDSKGFLKAEKRITYSKGRISLGRKSFVSQTDKLGTVKLSFGKLGPMEMKTGQMIRIRLASIQPAQEELKNTGNLANVGAGFQPGFTWPGKNVK